MLSNVKSFFTQMNLSQRFMVAGFVILLIGMVGIGAWVEKQIEDIVTHRTGATAALYVDSFVAPNLQELGESNVLLPEHLENLSNLLRNTPMGDQIVTFKVWDTRGRLLYSTDQSAIGKTFPMKEALLRARLGEVISQISSLDDEENVKMGSMYDELLETYSPVWLSGTNKVIAVAEFYQTTDGLSSEINALKMRSWFVVGAVILITYLLLSGFVRKTSTTILQQQSELGRKVTQLTELLAQNQELNERVRSASASVALLNESYLRRIGSELHDGPAQDLGLSLLKLDALAVQVEANAQEQSNKAVLDHLRGIEISLRNALKEMRAIAAGLSLPQLAELSLTETATSAVRKHERRTGTQVSLELGNVPEQIGQAVKITAYRLIQEALNNAFRHANGADQRVLVYSENDRLVILISDAGPGFDPKQASRLEGHLGVSGMRERVESLGGQFIIKSEIGKGTTILAYLPC